MLAPLLRDLIAAELPVLEARGLSMWGYVVLVALDQSPMRTQAALADAIGADRDANHPGPRRAPGAAVHRSGGPIPMTDGCACWRSPTRAAPVKNATQAEIQRGEERWLRKLPADDRRTFVRVLQQLAVDN